MSNRFRKRKPEGPSHLWSLARLALHQVSPHSLFGDSVWRFYSLVPGTETLSANWRLGIPEDIWQSRKFQRLLHDAKRVILAYIDADHPRPSTLRSKIGHIRRLILWMYQHEYLAFSQLDPQARREYFDFICGQSLDENSNFKVVAETIEGKMSVITLLFKLREKFLSVPRIQLDHGDMQAVIWSGFGRKVGAKSAGRIPPVPDEIFNPLMEEALQWVDTYSADILELVRIQEAAAAQCLSWNSKNYSSLINSRLEGYQFRLCPRTNSPWRTPLQSVEERVEEDEDGVKVRRYRPLRVVRTLTNHLLAACSIVIQGFTGIRVSELLGLTETGQLDDDLPSCIQVRGSMEGLNDVFLMDGLIFKGSRDEDTRKGTWVVGIRPAGSQFLPEVVRALLVLRELTAGWRPLTTDTNAFLHPRHNLGFSRTSGSVGRTRLAVLSQAQQSFLLEKVKVPSNLYGWHLTTHQFRKRFAQDVVRCDPDAMPAVREHFKHISMHVLETGYLGDDDELLKLVDDFALRDAAAQLMAIIDGEPVAGRMPEQFRRRTRDLESQVLNKLSKAERQQKVHELAESEGLRAWPAVFGTCLFRAETALCHLSVKGFYDSSAGRPLATGRCPDSCGACSNLVVSRRHISFWKNRYVENRRLALLYRDAGNATWGLLASRRAKVAEDFLRDHGITAKEL